MNATIILLDKWKAACSITSDNAAAIALGLSRQSTSSWRNGKTHPEAEIIQRMCNDLHEPLLKWLPLIEAERARTPANKRVWLQMAQSFAATGAMIAAMCLAVYTPKSHAYGREMSILQKPSLYTLCGAAKAVRRRLTKALRILYRRHGARHDQQYVAA